MYLTRMELDLRKRDTMRALASPSVLHGAVERAFSGERKRNLWRIDTLRGRTYLMLVSSQVPDLSDAYSQFGVDNSESRWETKAYAPFLRSINAGEVFRFRIIANPTYSVSQRRDENGTKPRGQIRGHKTPEYQKKWLMGQGARNGFVLNENDFEVTESKWKNFKKGKDNSRKLDIISVTYEGELTVTDAEKFRKALINGIGRGKAYGMGMMTVIRKTV